MYLRQNSQIHSLVCLPYSSGYGEKYQVSISYLPICTLSMYFTFVICSINQSINQLELSPTATTRSIVDWEKISCLRWCPSMTFWHEFWHIGRSRPTVGTRVPIRYPGNFLLPDGYPIRLSYPVRYPGNELPDNCSPVQKIETAW